jgi:sodium/potassium-transporting ATPase subunit alpha
MLSTDDFTSADYLLLVKGAPDILIPRCHTYLDASGTIRTLDIASIAELKKAQESFASQGQRVLLLARRVIPVDVVEKNTLSDLGAAEEFLKASTIDLTVFGLVALVDPPKPDTADTVHVCRKAGIRFAMVTGRSINVFFWAPLTFSVIRRLRVHCGCYRYPSWYYHRSSVRGETPGRLAQRHASQRDP